MDNNLRSIENPISSTIKSIGDANNRTGLETTNTRTNLASPESISNMKRPESRKIDRSKLKLSND